jgi:hypothetical protein
MRKRVTIKISRARKLSKIKDSRMSEGILLQS